jgi:sulfatase modifying factor 1
MTGDDERATPASEAWRGGPSTLRPGDLLAARYTVTAFVARGGMGEVYEARDAVLDETVALKTLISRDLDDSVAAQRFLAEARLARQVTHPNVCRIHDFGIHRPEPGRVRHGEAIPFLTMELLRGESIDRRLAREGRLDPDLVASLLLQISAGLHAIHAAGIVHRDIKPHNMFLLPGSRERLVLMDFGLARPLAADSPSTTGQRIVGTIDYMAPEQIEGQLPTTKIDIYAVGAVVFEMLTGRRPFTGTTVLSAAVDRLTSPPPRPSKIVPGLDRGWDELIARCLAADPAQRFDSVEQIVPPSVSARALSAPPRRRAWPWVLAGAAAMAAVGGVAWLRAPSPARVGAVVGAVGRHRPPRPLHRTFAASGCSDDMVRVANRFCIDRYEAQVVDDVEERAGSPYYPPDPRLLLAVLEDWQVRRANGTTGLPVPVPEVPPWERVDDWGPRAVSRRGLVPQGYISQILAERACASAGKRLCSNEEWTTACRGQDDHQFPYGPRYQAGACNVNRPQHPAQLLRVDLGQGLVDPRMNRGEVEGVPLLRPTGSVPSCASRWGDDAAYDLVGNLDEWTADPEGTLMGGFYSRDTREGCDATITRHAPAYYNYSTGFRCCDRLR